MNHFNLVLGLVKNFTFNSILFFLEIFSLVFVYPVHVSRPCYQFCFILSSVALYDLQHQCLKIIDIFVYCPPNDIRLKFIIQMSSSFHARVNLHVTMNPKVSRTYYKQLVLARKLSFFSSENS